MRRLNFYNFHKGINEYRFDNNNSIALVNELSKQFEVVRYELEGDGSFIYKNIPINHGSILIFEFDDSKEFKIYDFGDSPYLVKSLCDHPDFRGAVVGQYNPKLWNNKLIKPGIYPETIWNFGGLNYDNVNNYRKDTNLDKRLYWRGSLYNSHIFQDYMGAREAIELLPSLLQQDFYFGDSPIPFDNYIQESINFKMALSFGGGGGFIGAKCGDICFRDIEMFGLGIPLIRPKYIIETHDPLIPDYHYVSVDVEFTEDFKYLNHKKLSQKISQKYLDTINDDSFLDFISKNAREWYLNNLSSINITINLIKLLDI
jgi:hypothetical protein